LIWLKDNDVNKNFFHGMTSKRKRSNGIYNILVNGTQMEGV